MLAFALPQLRALAFAHRHNVASPWAWAGKHWRRFMDGRDGFQWWVSADEENYQGPYDTRDEAIRVAIAEGIGDEFNRVPGCQRFYLCEARQGPIDLSRYSDADGVLDQVCSRIDDEFGGEDGIDWHFWNREQEADLDRRLRAVVRAWQRRHKIRVRTWGFTATRETERYTRVETTPAATFDQTNALAA